MRTTWVICLLLIARTAGALPDDGVVKSEEFNFEIRIPPDSVDWTVEEIDEALKKQGHLVHFRTEFADSDPLATAEVRLIVTPMPRDFVHRSVDKISKKWAESFESHLSNPRDRTEESGKFGEVPYHKVDVKGDHLAGIHRRTWYLAKNGKFVYTLYVDRNYRAVTDEDLDEEIKAIVDSFKFLRVEKVEKHKKGAKKGGMPGDVGGPDGKSTKKAIDPELLKKETFKEPFWRFSVLKPEGLLKRKLTESDKKNDVKYWFSNDKPGSRLWLRVYAQTEKAKKWTIEQLLEHKLGYWEKEVKVKKDPVIDKRFKFPLAKKAIRIELVGRSTNTVRRIYILMDCKNDRQYQLEIYVTGTQGMKLLGKAIEQFIKNFKPSKK